MQPDPRYEILDCIASGDFAAVYRARDRELGREVAVKQIHQQFLSDPRQLARYWHEAQVLASLQHPNIVTIYDISRPRGWLILELMHGDLNTAVKSGPIDLNFLRFMLAGCLYALHFLHGNGIIHGDVKPSNILLDQQNRVKLGDFGLARRASSEQGSLLKGTTKYMAPEVLSDQFGVIGPASDLYSLGFSAYELACGPQFESLFPGMSTFGRDKQIAWMMWHSLADRNLPPIERVLQGVPANLAQVIQKLIVKDQSRRYQSAEEVVRDLQRGQQPPRQTAAEEDAAGKAEGMAAARKKQRMRCTAVGVSALSLLLCVAMLWPHKSHDTAKPQPDAPLRGVVTRVYNEELRLAIISAKDQAPHEIELKQSDKYFINGKPSLLRDLEPHDLVEIRPVIDEQGRRIKEVYASRPEMRKGRIKSVKPDEGTFLLSVEEGDDPRGPIVVPGELKIEFNGQPDCQGKAVTLADLRAGDRIVLHDQDSPKGRQATELSVQRVVTLEGIVARPFDAKSGKLSVRVGAGPQSRVVALPLAPQFVITVNGQPVAGPEGLKKDDAVKILHDTQIVRIDAQRVLEQVGTLRQVHFDARTLDVQGDEQQTTTYIVGPSCAVTLGGETAALDDLRAEDEVRIRHATLDARTGQAINAGAVAAVRKPDPHRWALLIAAQNYEDKSLSPLEYSRADAACIGDALTKRYRVAEEQILRLNDESLVRLEQAIPAWLTNIDARASVLVYVTGHAYKDSREKIYFAPKNFDLKRTSLTGLALSWLVEQIEGCHAKDKLLLLDCTHAGGGDDVAAEPSAAEMINSLPAAAPGRSPLHTLTAIASCRRKQRGLAWPERGHGLFAACLGEAYSGRADVNRNNSIDATALFGYLQKAMAEASSRLRAEQTAELFLPDTRPPRLSEAAKQSIRRLAAFLPAAKININSVRAEYAQSQQLAGAELEPRLLYGMLLMKAKARDAALRHFEELKIERPALLLPPQALVWLRFSNRIYPAGIRELTELIGRIPKLTKPDDTYSPEALHVFYWAGQLREFAAAAAPEPERPSADLLSGLDAAVAAHAAVAVDKYAAGQARTHITLEDFNKRIDAVPDEASGKLLELKLRQLSNYNAEFPYDTFRKQIL
ncbi:MAG: protein kinase, partial [Thermoguttaceae bacterium]